MSSTNSNIITPAKCSTTKVAMANEAVFMLSETLLAHQDLLDFAPTMKKSLESQDIRSITRNWEKVFAVIQHASNSL